MQSIDLNCDMGEGMDTDGDVMPFISSANIACGGHAGDEHSMKKTIELALKHHVAVGAHPSYPDKKNFGRKDIMHSEIETDALFDSLCGQLFFIHEICRQEGATLNHVKPHGALYNRAAKDPETADCICRAIRELPVPVFVFGLSGGLMKDAATSYSQLYINEVFADRGYAEDGSLLPRSQPGALIESEEICVNQSVQLALQGRVKTSSGKWIHLLADSICIHGDGMHAPAFARAIHQTLKKTGFAISSPRLKK